MSSLQYPPCQAEDEEFQVLGGLSNVSSYDAQDVLQSYLQNPPANIPLSAFDHDYTADIDEDSEISTQEDHQQHGDDIGPWPRRLLHVPSMTSLEWQPGNRYGDHIGPKYSAVSYTWGRYDLDIPGAKRQKKFRHVRGINVDGIDWPVPRINPNEQFSVDQFYNLIKQACEPVDGTDIRTEFLWLDVACIDQNNGPQKMAEIGRQAVIFQGAYRVFIWLTKLRMDTLSRVLIKLAQSYEAATYSAKAQREDYQASGGMMDWARTARASLDDLFVDPWFTSLWTLQEAFLCPQAYLVPLEATPMCAHSYQRLDLPATLGSLCTLAATLHETVERQRVIVEGKWQLDKTNAELSKQVKYLSEIGGMILQRGLAALASRSPMALYSVAQYRRTRNDQDRVYGIQQVFGLSLGASVPGKSNVDPKKFNRFVLEDQLGAALVERYPVASQLHVFTEPVEQGRGWRISGSSLVPELDIKSSIWDLRFKQRCRISTQKIQGQRWGVFDGQMCDFARLSTAWKDAHDRQSLVRILEEKSPQQVILDTVLKRKMADGDPEGLVWSGARAHQKPVPRGAGQHRLASALLSAVIEAFEGELPVVLLLGSFTDVCLIGEQVERGNRYYVGLILTRIKAEVLGYWKRLGICIWQYEYNGFVPKTDSSLNPDLLECGDDSSGWTDKSDLFG